MFIADAGTDAVIEVTPSGVKTTLESGLAGITGVAVDGNGDLFTADSITNQVLKTTPGVSVTVRPTPTSVSVAASSAATKYGQSETLTATVAGPSGSPTRPVAP